MKGFLIYKEGKRNWVAISWGAKKSDIITSGSNIFELLDNLSEAIECHLIANDKKLMRNLKRAKKEIVKGKFYMPEELRKRLKIE